MKYWLFKSEPHTWSWQQQLARGNDGETWDGVRNMQARNNMRDMSVGDLGFFYHSGKPKEIVGTVRVCAPYHPDHTDDSGRFGCVDVAAISTLPNPVTLAQVKADPELSDMALVRFSRLSVQPVTESQWRHCCELGGLSSAQIDEM